MIMKLDGYKTYVVAIATICYAFGGLIAGKRDFNTAAQLVFLGFGMMGLRHGIEQNRI